MTIQRIYLSEEIENQELDYDFMNTDVVVLLDDGVKYKASFIGIRKLVSDIQEQRKTSESFAKKYYWSRSMVIVDDLEKGDLFPLIEYMIEEGDFQMIFEKLS